jgi:hypothetical protein
VEITGFTAHPDRIAEVGPDYCIGHQPDAQHLRHNCGNPFDGENGVLPLGTLHVEVDGDAGQVRMISGLHVPVDLTTAAVAPADLAVVNDCIPGSAPDHDCDNNPDVSDLCPHFAEVAPAADANGNGRGDECECGDQSGDGFVNIDDIIAINRVLFGLEAPTPFCDAGGDINSVSPAPFDGECNIIDILRVNDVIFGSSAYCARHPFDP